MSGVSVGILWADFAMLQRQKEEEIVSGLVPDQSRGEWYLAFCYSRVGPRASFRTKVVQYSGGVEPLGVQVAMLRAEGEKRDRRVPVTHTVPHTWCSGSRYSCYLRGSEHPR